MLYGGRFSSGGQHECILAALSQGRMTVKAVGCHRASGEAGAGLGKDLEARSLWVRQQEGLQSCEKVLVTPQLFRLLSCPAQDLCLVREGLIGCVHLGNQ